MNDPTTCPKCGVKYTVNKDSNGRYYTCDCCDDDPTHPILTAICVAAVVIVCAILLWIFCPISCHAQPYCVFDEQCLAWDTVRTAPDTLYCVEMRLPYINSDTTVKVILNVDQHPGMLYLADTTEHVSGHAWWTYYSWIGRLNQPNLFGGYISEWNYYSWILRLNQTLSARVNP